jgi:hypothetical protein
MNIAMASSGAGRTHTPARYATLRGRDLKSAATIVPQPQFATGMLAPVTPARGSSIERGLDVETLAQKGREAEPSQ